MNANLIETLLAEANKACDEHADLMRAAADALAQAEAQPEAIFTMEQFGGLVGLAREHARERAVVYRATDYRGDTCYFGAKSAALAWAKDGTVEEVPVRDLRVVSAPQPAAPESSPPAGKPRSSP